MNKYSIKSENNLTFKTKKSTPKSPQSTLAAISSQLTLQENQIPKTKNISCFDSFMNGNAFGGNKNLYSMENSLRIFQETESDLRSEDRESCPKQISVLDLGTVNGSRKINSRLNLKFSRRFEKMNEGNEELKSLLGKRASQESKGKEFIFKLIFFNYTNTQINLIRIYY